jgi:hypothetical protein
MKIAAGCFAASKHSVFALFLRTSITTDVLVTSAERSAHLPVIHSQ